MIKRKEILQILFLTVVMFVTLSIDVHAANCTALSRTNNSANTVLTSSKYNTDHNTAYTGINDIIASNCTIPLASVNPTDVAPLTDALHAGCKVSKSNDSTISVSACYLGVNGALVETSVATTTSFGCTNCSAEVAETKYYVYAADGSTGSTLTLLILTTAPNENGYDGSNNRVLGKFYNNHLSNIETYSIDQWAVNDFQPQLTDWSNYGTISITGTTTNPTKGTIVVDEHYWRRDGEFIHGRIKYQQSGGSPAAGSGDYLFAIANPDTLKIDDAKVTMYTTLESSGNWDATEWGGACSWTQQAGFSPLIGMAVPYDNTHFRCGITSLAVANYMSSAATNGGYWGANLHMTAEYRFPIKGWEP